MSIEQICALGVGGIAHQDCLLWLWTTNHHMREAFTVLDAWGFKQKTILTWAKDRMGTRALLRGQTEHCLLAVRGKPAVELTNQTTLLHGPLRANSQKRRRATPICSRTIATTKNGIATATRRRQPKRMRPNERTAQIMGTSALRRRVRQRRDLSRARP
jgi:N6-adenosine-specific RNA methylase IME4